MRINTANYQKEIRHMRELMNYIIHFNTNGVAVHDKFMNYIYASQKYLDQFHVKEKDIIGKNHYEVFPDLPEKWREVHKEVLNGQIRNVDRDPFFRADGTVDWTRWECRPWYERGGSVGGIIVYTEVINEQIEAEHALEERIREADLEKNRLEAALSSVSDAVITADEAGIIRFANEAAVKLLGGKDLTGKSFAGIVSLYNESADEETGHFIQKAIQAKTRYSGINLYLLTENKEKHYIEFSASPIVHEAKMTGSVIIMKDVTDRKVKEQEIEYLAAHDEFTGCFNRRYMVEKLIRWNSEKLFPLGLIMADINGLKIINDAYGYRTGDELVKAVARLLTSACKEQGFVARIGGDEFAIILPETNQAKLEEMKETIKTAMDKIQFHDVNVSLSIGLSIRENEARPIAQFYTGAENNMFKHKLLNGQSRRNNTIKAILKTLTDKYEKERIHSQRVSSYCKLLGEALALSDDEVHELEMAGLYHDIGKISVPDAILNKPGKLTEAEFAVIKTHTITGYQILKAADAYSNLAEYALMHHERYDGKGYPSGLKGTEIPRYSRIVAIADAFEAMTTNRVYRNKLTFEEAVREIKNGAGTQFDPELAEVFITRVLSDSRKRQL